MPRTNLDFFYFFLNRLFVFVSFSVSFVCFCFAVSLFVFLNVGLVFVDLIFTTESSMLALAANPRVRNLVQSDSQERWFPLVLRRPFPSQAEMPSLEPHRKLRNDGNFAVD